jgi:hypothetical protein
VIRYNVLLERQPHHRPGGCFSQAVIARVLEYADDGHRPILLARKVGRELRADRIAIAKALAGQRLIDDGDGRGFEPVGLGEGSSPDDAHAHRVRSIAATRSSGEPRGDPMSAADRRASSTDRSC